MKQRHRLPLLSSPPTSRGDDLLVSFDPASFTCCCAALWHLPIPAEPHGWIRSRKNNKTGPCGLHEKRDKDFWPAAYREGTEDDPAEGHRLSRQSTLAMVANSAWMGRTRTAF